MSFTCVDYEMRVMNRQGVVRELRFDGVNENRYHFTWDIRDRDGKIVPSGIYKFISSGNPNGCNPNGTGVVK